jgi:SAM-dependent methyltransferase
MALTTAGAALAAIGTVANEQISAAPAQPAQRPASGAKGVRAPVLPEGTLAPRGRFGRMERLPTLDLESRQDFLQSFRAWANRDLSRAAAARADAIVARHGYSPEADIPLPRALEMLQNDPLLQTSTRAWLSCQQLAWNGLREEFEGNADRYLAEMEAVDRRGPGSLELDPDIELPDYVRHEIHIQPGGYVGHPFAGHLYHYGTNGFYSGRNTQDELHVSAAQRMPLPADGKVRRILDLGTGIGQLAMALKERFPDAEVWGIDVGAPMVRYAHLRAVERDLDVHFAQRPAEDTKFPDGYFDLVVSYIMFHEVSPAGAQAIVNEAYRITRPGGVFYPIDFRLTNAPRRSAYGLYRLWWDHRWNNEVWTLKFRSAGLPDLIRAAGFSLNETEPVVLENFGVLNATKPA